jgi:hypothetical protein
METRKTFKAGTYLVDIAAYIKQAADGLTGESGSVVLVESIKVVVSTASAGIPLAAVVGIVDGLELPRECVPMVNEFLRYRTEDKKKPIKTAKTLVRLLKPFNGKPDHLRESIEESITQSWTGLFMQELKGGTDRKQERGESDGGTW